MTNFNQISKKYYRKAKHEMPLCYAEKKLYLAELSETLHAIETEHPYHERGRRADADHFGILRTGRKPVGQ